MRALPLNQRAGALPHCCASDHCPGASAHTGSAPFVRAGAAANKLSTSPAAAGSPNVLRSQLRWSSL